MYITKKHLSRRAVLRGLGVSLALPLLDSMIPAQTPLGKTAASPKPHLGFIYFPHGAIMDQWTPAKEGADFEITPILKPLAKFKKEMTVISGLGNRAADSSAVHATAPGTWLSGVTPRKTHEPFGGITIDQIAGQHIGQDTPLPTLELATEERYSGGGACDRDYGCSYAGTISFRTPSTPLPMEYDPHKVFGRLFGEGTTPDERKSRKEEYGSILDAIARDAASLKNSLGPDDRAKLGDYLESVREIERRVQNAGKSLSEDVKLPEISPGIPTDFEERINLMFDMAALAYQGNLTRIFSLMMCREASNLTYGQIGVPDAFHPISHHQNNPARLKNLTKIQTYHSQIFARFLDRLKAMPDGDGSIYDHSLFLYGSNMSNSNMHNHFPLPLAVIGGACGKVKGNQHVRYPDRTPMANLLLAILDRAGVPMDKMGDSTSSLVSL